jgi:hypothetical protein
MITKKFIDNLNDFADKEDIDRWVVGRGGSVDTNKERLEFCHETANRSLTTLRKAFSEDPNFMRFKIPKEDMYFQFDNGGTQSNPILIGMFYLDQYPIVVPSDRTLEQSREFKPFVIPLFTSISRLTHFWNILVEYGGFIPKERTQRIVPITNEIWRGIEGGNIVINPIPELVLTAYQVIKLVNGKVEFILVYIEPEKKPSSFASFFNRRK